MSSCVVREAVPGDAPGLVALAQAVGAEPEGWLIADESWRGVADERRYLKAIKRHVSRLQSVSESERARIAEALKNSRALATAMSMRDELAEIWERSSASREQLVAKLQDWCHRAESSGVVPLVEISRRLRSYA